jgi:hypothetical protein
VDPAGAADPAGHLTTVAEPVLAKIAAWTGRSWSHRVGWHRTRAQVVRAAVQQLADLAAAAERRPRAAVPRIDADTLPGAGLADQLAVMVHDVVQTGDPTACRRAADLIDRLGADLHLTRV